MAQREIKAHVYWQAQARGKEHLHVLDEALGTRQATHVVFVVRVMAEETRDGETSRLEAAER